MYHYLHFIELIKKESIHSIKNGVKHTIEPDLNTRIHRLKTEQCLL
jgi:hypothetical protein